eukprot:CAMPEP_0185263110 /NCGR_PEP_ID=MMETSP1359-20130426/11083_1 /TAXON_ID=552665 /ORGANISM="Bigelowiella longifila, Strain CCMP242" /LENGTH=207 /DNA_ID=CAMNT_0027850231 /DNA_START=1204 /DNA_END=1827 /DNA_ORIENTATION=+
MKLLSRYQMESRDLKPNEVAQCRMVVFLRGLGVRRPRPSQQPGLLQHHSNRRGSCRVSYEYKSGEESKESKLPSTAAGAMVIEVSDSAADEAKLTVKQRFQEETAVTHNETAIECIPPPREMWTRPLEAMALDPLFDPSIFKIINGLQSSLEDIETIPLEDYLHFRLWRDCDKMEHNEIQRIRRKLQKHRWKVWDEKKKLEITPKFI